MESIEAVKLLFERSERIKSTRMHACMHTHETRLKTYLKSIIFVWVEGKIW